jgi:hypothetical protein
MRWRFKKDTGFDSLSNNLSAISIDLQLNVEIYSNEAFILLL